jgi:hypothetical protein
VQIVLYSADPLSLIPSSHCSDVEGTINADVPIISIGGLKYFSASFTPSVMAAPNNPFAVVEAILCISLQKLSQARRSLK